MAVYPLSGLGPGPGRPRGGRQEHGLPDPRLPGYQDQPTLAPPCFIGVLGQRLQKRRPLQQLHHRDPIPLPGLWPSPAGASIREIPRAAVT